jgi:hypothetical protein
MIIGGNSMTSEKAKNAEQGNLRLCLLCVLFLLFHLLAKDLNLT